ncbi:hypothetical protein CK203_031201 [Vitis vinifera]|uniref:Uncharacterized protein n=1 Tax=Vitis vinifera TaxID=29760 RepID=A0A438J0G8_VITVI|nr:hypothetical protein CK203_031201 [Vitis vinifera]
MSGLRINLEKSELLPLGRVENIRVGARVWMQVAVWDGVEEKFQKRLALWKGWLGQIQRDFLWGGGALERRPHLVSWRGRLIRGKLSTENTRKEDGTPRRRVRLWKDKWCGDELLCISFPLYLLKNSSKEAWMEEVWSHSSEEGCWAQCFSKHFNDWEMKSLECFLLRLHGRRVFKDREDEILWTESKDRAFFVKSLYRVLELGRRSVFPIRLAWFFRGKEKEEGMTGCSFIPFLDYLEGKK